MNTEYETLVDRNEIAMLLGVGPTAISNYVARSSMKHGPFPDPVIVRGLGRFRLWELSDIIAWHADTFPSRDHVWDDDVTSRLVRFRSSNH